MFAVMLYVSVSSHFTAVYEKGLLFLIIDHVTIKH